MSSVTRLNIDTLYLFNETEIHLHFPLFLNNELANVVQM